MGTIRRAGIAAAAVAGAARARLPLRARLPRPGRLPAPHPPQLTPADLGLPFESMLIESDGAAAAGLVHPGPRRRARSRRRPRPRLGVGARPDAADRRLPPRRRLPLPDLRRPRPRRQPGRGAAAERRRVRAGRAGRVPGARRPARGDRRRDRRPLDGRDRGDPRGRRRPARRGGRRDVRPGRSVPADPPDVPPRPPADPRPDRLPAGLADDPRLPPAARPRRRRHQRGDARSPATTGRSCSPTATRTRSCRSSHMDRLAAAARAARAGDPIAAQVETLVVEGGQHSWLYEDPGYRARVAGFLARALGGPLDPADGGRRRRGDRRRADPRRREPSSRRSRRRRAASGRSPRSRCPGATRPPRPDDAGDPTHRRAGRSPAPPASRERPVSEPRRDGSGLGRDRHGKRVVRRFADRPLEPAHLERILSRPARRQQQEPAALDVHRLPRPGAPAPSSPRSGRGPATSPAPPSGSPS